jgi:orotidine-5'-phosphate decarboxylase
VGRIRWPPTDGLDRFADIALEAAAGTVGLVKLQAAFYERHGWRGFRTLQRLIADGRAAGLLVIVDAKRGDVGTTNDAYAEAFLGTDGPLAADALTVHPYLGVAAMGTFLHRAYESGSCLLFVTRSSNTEGRVIQSATTATGLSVEEALLRDIGELNTSLAPGRIGPVGAVIGPTHVEPALDLLAPNALYLAPGVGAQGATPADVANVFAACPNRVIPSASRSLLEPGPDLNRLRDSLGNGRRVPPPPRRPHTGLNHARWPIEARNSRTPPRPPRHAHLQLPASDPSVTVNSPGFRHHSGVGVEQLQLAWGAKMTDDERPLSDPPQSFTASQVGELVDFGG